MRPGRQLAVLGLLFVVLYLLVFFARRERLSFTERLQPKLGLDLVGGTQVTLEATHAGRPAAVRAESLEQARQIIESRVNALGVSEAEVVIEGNRNIVVSLAGETDDQLQARSAQAARAAVPQGAQGDRRRSGRGRATPTADAQRQPPAPGAVGVRRAGRAGGQRRPAARGDARAQPPAATPAPPRRRPSAGRAGAGRRPATRRRQARRGAEEGRRGGLGRGRRR